MPARSDEDRLILHVEKARTPEDAARVRRALWCVDGVYAVQFSERDRIAVVHAVGGEKLREPLLAALKDASFGTIDAVLDRVNGLTWENARTESRA